MNYHVYRMSGSKFKQLGSTLYVEDAKAILKNWAAGYVVDRYGEMVFSKGLDTGQDLP